MRISADADPDAELRYTSSIYCIQIFSWYLLHTNILMVSIGYKYYQGIYCIQILSRYLLHTNILMVSIAYKYYQGIYCIQILSRYLLHTNIIKVSIAYKYYQGIYCIQIFSRYLLQFLLKTATEEKQVGKHLQLTEERHFENKSPSKSLQNSYKNSNYVIVIILILYYRRA